MQATDPLLSAAVLVLAFIGLLILKGVVTSLAGVVVRAWLLTLVVVSLRWWRRMCTAILEAEQRDFERAEFDRYVRRRYKRLRRRGYSPDQVAVHLLGPALRDVPGDIWEAMGVGGTELIDRFLGAEWETFTCANFRIRDEWPDLNEIQEMAPPSFWVIRMSIGMCKDDLGKWRPDAGELYVTVEPRAGRRVDTESARRFEGYLAGLTMVQVMTQHERPGWLRRQIRTLDLRLMFPLRMFWTDTRYRLYFRLRGWRIDET